MGFPGRISDRWLRHCHCVILPSLGGEGVPNVLLEAAATGRPCIASDVNGSVDVVEDGRERLHLPPGRCRTPSLKRPRSFSASATRRNGRWASGAMKR